MANALSTIDLLEQCLPAIEDKYLRCSDPWSFFIMCTAIMLIKIHLGKETRQTAKAACARRFLDLYYKNVWMHHPSDLAQQQAISRDIANQTSVSSSMTVNAFTLSARTAFGDRSKLTSTFILASRRFSSSCVSRWKCPSHLGVA